MEERMKIKLRPRNVGSTVLTIFLIIAACAMLITASCVAKRISDKVEQVRKEREKQLTNHLDQVIGEMRQDYQASGMDTSGAVAVGLVIGLEITNGQAPRFIALEATHDLSSWETVGGTNDLGQKMAEGITNRNLPYQFFRFRADP